MISPVYEIMSTRRQCAALIKDRSRQCGNSVTSPETLCWRHKNDPNVVLAGRAPSPTRAPAASPAITAPPRPASPIKAVPVPTRAVTPRAASPTKAAPAPVRAVTPRTALVRPASPPRHSTLGNVIAQVFIIDHRDEFPLSINIDDKKFNITDTAIRPTYIPITRPMPQDAANVQKIGGKMALLLEGEEWPADSQLIIQFIDPLKNDFVRVFLTGDEDDEPRPTILRAPIDDTRPVRVATEPPGIRHITDRYDKPLQITGWELRNEAGDDWVMEILRDKEENGDEWQELVQEVMNTVRVPKSFDIKLFGYGDSSQGIQYTPYVTNVYYQSYGDMGTIHVTEDGRMEGDMG